MPRLRFLAAPLSSLCMDKAEKAAIDGQTKAKIQELIASRGGGHNPDLVEDIIANALKLLTDVKDRGDASVIRTAVRELRYAFRSFAPYQEVRKVTIFGSARTLPTKQEYIQAVHFSKLI